MYYTEEGSSSTSYSTRSKNVECLVTSEGSRDRCPVKNALALVRGSYSDGLVFELKVPPVGRKK